MTQFRYQPRSLFFLSVLPILLTQISCIHEPVDLYLTDTICFDNQVLPLLHYSCGTLGCHDDGTTEGDFIVTSYESIMELVKPGHPKESKLYTVLIDIWGENFMPPDKPLPISDRNLIQLWIAQGALKTECEIDTNNGNPIPDTLCFVQDILPIFLSACATSGCHDAITHQDEYNLTTYTSIMSNDEGIVPKYPDQSEIYEVITDNEPENRMPPPPRAALTSEQISAIRDWILEGAVNSDCPQYSCDTLLVISFSNQVFSILQNNSCVSCHSSSPANGGVLLNNYENVREAAITERNGTSLIVGAIRNQSGFSPMPPDNPMSTCSIRIIELWIEQGTQNN